MVFSQLTLLFGDEPKRDRRTRKHHGQTARIFGVLVKEDLSRGLFAPQLSAGQATCPSIVATAHE
jgi:hypothetical protein